MENVKKKGKLPKILLAVVIVLVVLAIIGSNGGDKEESSVSENTSSSSSVNETAGSESSESSEVSIEEKVIETKPPKYVFAIKSASFGKDYNGADVLIVEYDYTNNSDKATSFAMACEDKAFQNGVECDSGVIGCDDVDSQQQWNDIQPGTTYTLKVGYNLGDTTSPVNIVVKDFLGYNEYINQTIELQ